MSDGRESPRSPSRPSRSTGPTLAERLAARIRASGPMRFSVFVEAALYDPDGGFYATGGHAGRRGDFLTSPEVGPLFGAVVARAIDRWWIDAGRPATFTFVEAGAGPGTLARAVVAARPECLAAGALGYVAVERSERQRRMHPSGIDSRSAMPDALTAGVVFANELLDNLAFDVAVWDGGWQMATVDVDRSGAAVPTFVEVLRPLGDDLRRVASCLPEVVPHGSRAPLAVGAAAWLAEALELIEPAPAGAARVVAVDYCRPTAELATCGWRSWLRTFRGHERGIHPLLDPGSQDITTDVPLDQLAAVTRPADRVVSQARFLTEHGISDLLAEGRRTWAARAHLGDLAALTARSRLSEGDALTDPDGLGGFTLAEWCLPRSSSGPAAVPDVRRSEPRAG